ncbi:MAG: hypothetical protein HYZ75_07890 [Elusimicrobia bacterium]|nr:hypothetical protein [Elusimicrobiota bacterium]
MRRPYRFETLKLRGFAQLAAQKLLLPLEVGQVDSVRDYGGGYRVAGRYLLETAAALKAGYAQLIDGTPSPAFDVKARAFARKHGARVSYLRADFRDKELYARLPAADVSLLYEVLLHQDNAVEVLRNVTRRTRRAVCVAQPCLKDELFPLPAAAVNLQFYPAALKAKLRKGVFWPRERTPERFDTARWMWGQTTSWLLSVFWGLGWEPERVAIDRRSFGKYWEYSFLRFRRRGPR